jgi:glycosyltransferase involved in cell wall biosynthesis
MKSCSALVQPSHFEGMPNSLFEAMAADLPVIASRIEAHTNWITPEENGLLFPGHCPDQLASAIQRILSESTLRNRLITNGRTLVETLSIQKMVERYEEFYLSC